MLFSISDFIIFLLSPFSPFPAHPLLLSATALPVIE
jgi:hypothetical protein